MKTKMKNKLIVSLLCASVGAVSLSLAVANINVASAEENALTMTMRDSASIRYNDPKGIRFETTYSATDFSAYENYTFGTLVIPSNLLDGELTHETANVQDIRKIDWYEDGSSENEKVMRSVLTNIPTASLGRELSARSYYFDGTSYTYSDITVERSIAQTASLLLNQGKANGHEADLNAYVNAVSEGLETSVTAGATIDMVVGGKETITATTNPANYGVVWTSSVPEVATVSNGVITAVANGETTITVAFGTEYECSYTVKVADYVQRDGSEIVYTTENPSVGNYGLSAEMVGGRTGVYKYSSTAKEWTDKLNVKVGGHLNSDQGPVRTSALRAFKTKGYNYVAFDIYMTKGAYLMVSSLINADDYSAGTGTSIGVAFTAGSTFTNTNENLKVYNLGKEVSAISVDTWYTFVVDYSQIDVDVYADGAGVYSRIEIGGIMGTVYFDNVRYYGNTTWQEDIVPENNYLQYDGSEFVKAAPWSDSTGSYGLYEGTVQGRTGVYKYSSTLTNWNDKISVKQTNHLGTKVYNSNNEVKNNMVGNNYTYVTFDLCMESGAIVINVPDIATGSTTSTQKTDKVWVGSEITKASNNIKYYSVDENGVYTEVTKLLANQWYTVVVAYDWSVTYTGTAYAGIDIGSWSKANVYFDNVRYYTVNPVA